MLKKCSSCGLKFVGMSQSQIYSHTDWCEVDDYENKTSKKDKENDRRRNGRRKEKSYEDFD